MLPISDKDRRIALLVILNVVLAATLGTVIGMYVKSGGLDDTRDAVTLDQVSAQIGALADSIDARVGVAVIFEDGETLLYKACDSNKIQTVKYLLRKSFKLLEIRNKFGKSPLEIAFDHNFMDIVDYILSCKICGYPEIPFTLAGGFLYFYATVLQ